MIRVYLNSSGESVLDLDIGLSVSSKGVSKWLGFFIFNSDSCPMKSSKVGIMGKDHLFFEMGQYSFDYQFYLFILWRVVSHFDSFSSPSCNIIKERFTRLLLCSFQISASYIQLSIVFILLDELLSQ